MSRFDDIDLVDVPDQWDDIAQRADQVPVQLLEPERHRFWLGGAVAAGVVVVALVAGVVAFRGADGDEAVTLDTATVDTEAVEPAVVEPAASESSAPELACAGGELAAGSIPVRAAFGEGSIWSVEEFADIRATATWSWKVDGLDVQLIVPGIPWTDFVGERTEALTGDPEGTLAYMRDPAGTRETVNVMTPTGVDEPCDWSEVVVAGGTEAERMAVALDAARALEWVPIEVDGPEDVVDEATMRTFTLAAAQGEFAGGSRLEMVGATRYWSESGLGGGVSAGPSGEPQWVWAGIALGSTESTEGGGSTREHLFVHVGESGRWNVFRLPPAVPDGRSIDMVSAMVASDRGG